MGWFSVKIEKGVNQFDAKIVLPNEIKNWKGKALVWLIDEFKQISNQVTFELNKPAAEKVMPPKPFAEGNTQHNVKIGEFDININ